MTAIERFDNLRDRAIARDPIDADQLGRAVLDWNAHGQASDDAAIREAVADMEESVSLVLGTDPDGTWLSMLDSVRAGTHDANALRMSITGHDMSVMRQAHIAIHGRSALKVQAAPVTT